MAATFTEHLETMTEADRAEALEWFNSRPESIQKLIEERPPHLEYRWRNAEDGSIHPNLYRIVAYEEPEDGSEPTMRVYTEGLIMSREVFGVDKETLIPVETK